MRENLEKIKNKLLQNGKYWIAFTGDSITSCEWVHPNWRDIVLYVLHDSLTDLLDGDWKLAEWGIRGFNFAYDGATTADIIEKIDDMLLVKPDLVLSVMGGNDPTFAISPEDSVKNIEVIAQKLIENACDVVWSNSTPAATGDRKNSEYQPYADAFVAMPEIVGLQKIDMFHAYQAFPSDRIFTFISEENPVEGIKAGDIDAQHPNQLGNAYIAKVILDQVFGITFDPEKYIADTNGGEKLPKF